MNEEQKKALSVLMSNILHQVIVFNNTYHMELTVHVAPEETYCSEQGDKLDFNEINPWQ